jgi:predicted molibdopterin-dependent oxidoreductase YjgC
VTGLVTVLGSGAMTNSINGIVDSDVMLVIGSNTTETHPIIGLRMLKAVKKGSKLIVADPRRIKLCDSSELWMQQRPGTDGALINALCHVILRDGLEDKDYIAERTENFTAFQESVAACTPEWAEKITNVPAASIVEAAHIFARAERAGIYYTMGITQHTSGTDNVCALANLAMITGNLGKAGAGLNPLRGQNNVQGASDMGCNPTFFPGYQRCDDDAARAKFAELWETEITDKPGLMATEIPAAILDGRVAGLWIMGENPIISDPNSDHARKAFEQLDFLVVQDIFLTETAEIADVVLPAASFAEKDGTFANTERLVQRVRRAIPPPGEARDDLTIINMISNKMLGNNQGSYQGFVDPLYHTVPPQAAEVFEETTRCWQAMAGMSYERLEKESVAWPCPAPDHPGTPILHMDGFPRGRGWLSAITWNGPDELPDTEYPLILTTGRVLYQYHTGTMTRRSEVLESSAPSAYVEMHPADAAVLGLEDNEEVQASSRRGSIRLPVRITDRVRKGLVFIPFHYREAAANLLTNDALDPKCKIPEAKVCAIKVKKIVKEPAAITLN